ASSCARVIPRQTISSMRELYQTGLFAELTRREIAVVARLLPELRRIVFPIRADVGVSLEHRVPEFIVVVAEHLLLLDFLDIDVLDRALGREIELDRATRRIDLNV